MGANAMKKCLTPVLSLLLASHAGMTFAQTQTDSVRVTTSTDQALATNTWTLLSFSTESFDTNDLHDNTTNNNRLVVKTAGKYVVGGEVFMGATAGSQVGVAIIKNGAWLADNRVAPQGFGNRHTVVTLVDMAVNDYVQLAIYHDSGS